MLLGVNFLFPILFVVLSSWVTSYFTLPVFVPFLIVCPTLNSSTCVLLSRIEVFVVLSCFSVPTVPQVLYLDFAWFGGDFGLMYFAFNKCC